MDGKEMYTRFWLENLKERDQLEHPSADGRIILTRIFKKENGMVWTGLILLTIGIKGGLL
jgi:hypothetical protein